MSETMMHCKYYIHIYEWVCNDLWILNSDKVLPYFFICVFVGLLVHVSAVF